MERLRLHAPSQSERDSWFGTLTAKERRLDLVHVTLTFVLGRLTSDDVKLHPGHMKLTLGGIKRTGIEMKLSFDDVKRTLDEMKRAFDDVTLHPGKGKRPFDEVKLPLDDVKRAMRQRRPGKA